MTTSAKKRPADWRTSWYYRYYHDPGHHNTAAHYGVRTATHKLIYYWKKDAYELFDLTKDPTEQHNLLFGLTNDAFGYILTRVDWSSFKRYD